MEVVIIVMVFVLSRGHDLDPLSCCGDACSSRLILLAFLASTGVTFLVLGCALQQYKYAEHIYFQFMLLPNTGINPVGWGAKNVPSKLCMCVKKLEGTLVATLRFWDECRGVP